MGPTKQKAWMGGNGETALYDISKDPTESRNLARQHPEIVAELLEMAQDWGSDLPKSYDKDATAIKRIMRSEERKEGIKNNKIRKMKKYLSLSLTALLACLLFFWFKRRQPGAAVRRFKK